MYALAAWYTEWVPFPLIRRTGRHAIGYIVTVGSFYGLVQFTKQAVPFPWVADWLDRIHIFVVLALGLGLALELLVPFIRELREALRRQDQ